MILCVLSVTSQSNIFVCCGLLICIASGLGTWFITAVFLALMAGGGARALRVWQTYKTRHHRPSSIVWYQSDHSWHQYNNRRHTLTQCCFNAEPAPQISSLAAWCIPSSKYANSKKASTLIFGAFIEHLACLSAKHTNPNDKMIKYTVLSFPKHTFAKANAFAWEIKEFRVDFFSEHSDWLPWFKNEFAYSTLDSLQIHVNTLQLSILVRSWVPRK